MLGGDLRIPQPRRGPLATAENFEGVTIKNEGIIALDWHEILKRVLCLWICKTIILN